MTARNTESELTPKQQEKFDRRGNYPFTDHGVREGLGAPVPDPNQATQRIIGAEASRRILEGLKAGIPVHRAERQADADAKSAAQDEEIQPLLSDPK